MIIKILGALLIVIACAFIGYQFSVSYIREISHFKDLIWALDNMERELQYRLTPLPDLCRSIFNDNGCKISQIFLKLADLLDSHTENTVFACMEIAIMAVNIQSARVNNLLLNLGKTLGKFDVSGQIKGMQTIKEESIAILNSLSLNQKEKVRSIKTIGLCAGIAIAILLM